MIRRRILSLLLSMLLGCCAHAAAQTQGMLYGGRGDERISGAVPCEGGLFAVGYTYSTDGDLSMRTRSGKTGWAMRLDEAGEIVFCTCSAHVGRDEMASPHAHADGTFSCILQGEDQGAEWLRISDAGKIISRIELPEAAQLCKHDPQGTHGKRQFIDGPQGAALAVEVLHSDETKCMASVDENGGVSFGSVYEDGLDMIRAPLHDGSGRIAALYTQDAQAVITWITPGQESKAHTVRVPVEEGVLEWIVSAVACEDGSLIFSGQLAGGGGVIMRVSGSAEVLFSTRTSDPGWVMAQTDTGFAALNTQEIMFFDEDGALQGVTPMQFRWETPIEAIMTGYNGGVAVIENLKGSKTRQIAVTAVRDYTEAAGDVYEGIDSILFTRTESELVAAQQTEGGVLLLAQDQDGQTVRLLADESGASEQTQETAQRRPVNGWTLGDGQLTWRADERGTRVLRLCADGSTAWETRIVIHTAADSAQWICMAQEENGDILLGGRYLTEERYAARQEAVIARISADGVLREVFTIEGLGCVCAMLPRGEELILLACASTWPRMEADVLQTLGSEPFDWQALGVFIDAKDAWLFEGGDGSVLVAGTSRRNGRTTAVFQRLEIQ